MTFNHTKSNLNRFIVFFFCISVLSSQFSYGQFSTIFTEDFEGCGVATLPITCGPNAWLETGIGSRWTTSNGLCIIGGLYSLAVGSDATFCEYNVDIGTSDRIAYVQFSTAGFHLLDINFDWRCMGEIGIDYGKAVYSNDGVTWNDISLIQYQGQVGTQIQPSLPIPTALDDDPTAFIGFRWVDNATIGAFPGFIVDNISIQGEQIIPPDPVTPLSPLPLACDSIEIRWGGTPPSPSNVLWYWQDSLCGTDTTLGSDTSLTVFSTGTYYIRAFNSVSGQWSVGCDSVSVIVDGPPPISNAGSGGVACGLSFPLSAVPSLGSSLWSMVSGPGIAIFSDTVSPNNLATVPMYGSYVFMWSEINGSCSDSDTVSVTFSEPPLADAGTGGTVCDLGFGFTASSSVGVGTWSQISGSGLTTFNNVNNPNTSGTVTSFGTYIYQWIELNSICSDTDTITVTFYEQPIANSGSGGIECDLNFTLSASPSVGSGSWSQVFGPGISTYADSNNATTSVTVSSQGSYVYRWTETNGTCSDFQDVYLTYNLIVSATAGPDTSVSLGNSVMLYGQGGVNYLWQPDTFLSNPNISNPIASPLVPTTYVVTVTDINGCSDIDTIEVDVNVDYNFLVSNLLTPNGDGYNDTWYIDNVDFYSDCEVSIYNRFGNLLYNKKGYKNDWDGKHNGQELPDGTYYYVIKCLGATDVFKGGITILRKN